MRAARPSLRPRLLELYRKLAGGAHVRPDDLRDSRKLHQVYKAIRFKAGCAQGALRVVLVHHYHRCAHLAALVALPIQRPGLVLANLCAKLAVLLLKGERLFLRLEQRLDWSERASVVSPTWPYHD